MKEKKERGNKRMIEESKILEFIKKNDKRIGSVLNKYDDLIKRLLVDEKISLNAIYEFIFENDNKIGNKANFYKYCKRFKTVSNKTATTKPKEKEVIQKPVTSNLTPATAKPINAKDILSQNFDLLEFSK